jgi:hypothetical protein
VLKFIHTADWQIGRVYSQFEEDDAAALFEARFKTVETIAQLAAAHAVDAVLVAGDVFDLQTVSDKSIRRLFLAMRDYAGPWYLIPGNHDSSLSESVWSRAHRLGVVPANVHCCLLPEVHLLEGKMAILPAPLCQRHTYSDLTEWFSTAETPQGLPRIGLAHGSVQGILAEGIDSSNPIAAGRADTGRLDYLALGDWHGTRQVDGRTWYSGTHETDRFKDNDSGQALLVTLQGAGSQPVVEPLKTGLYQWVQLDCAIDVPSDVDVLIGQLGEFNESHVIGVSLTGTCDLACHQRIARAMEELGAQARAVSLSVGQLQLEPTEEDIQGLQAQGYVGDVLHQLRMLQATEKTGTVRQALLILAGQLDAQSAGTAGVQP